MRPSQPPLSCPPISSISFCVSPYALLLLSETEIARIGARYRAGALHDSDAATVQVHHISGFLTTYFYSEAGIPLCVQHEGETPRLLLVLELPPHDKRSEQEFRLGLVFAFVRCGGVETRVREERSGADIESLRFPVLPSSIGPLKVLTPEGFVADLHELKKQGDVEYAEKVHSDDSAEYVRTWRSSVPAAIS